MLISKTTRCFQCGAPGFGNRSINAEEPGYEIAIDRCRSCGAQKETMIGALYPRELAGAVAYRRPDGTFIS